MVIIRNREQNTEVVEVPMFRGQVALIDATDLVLVSAYKWSAQRRGVNVYAVTGVAIGSRKTGDRKVVSIKMHRLIMRADKGQWVDHIDGNGLNNTRSNLRIANPVQSAQNRKPRTGYQYKGISFCTRDKVWRASIKLNGKRKNLGTFIDPKSAALAYDAAAIEHFGEFARTNF